MLENVLGMTIGFFAMFGTLLLILIVVIMDNKSRRIRSKLLHDERMLALEKGLPVPMELGDFGKQRRPYVRGLVFTAFGLGIICWGSWIENGDSGSIIGFGFIPLFIGIALIIADALSKSKKTQANSASMESVPYSAESLERTNPDNPS